MLESMTGYGSAEKVENGLRILAELRSVNNRFAEISVKLPRQLSNYELDIRDLVRSRFQRGKISVFVQVQAERDRHIPVVVNPDRVKAYRDLLETVRHEAGIETPVSLEHLLKFSEIFDTESRTEENSELLWSLVRSVLPDAVEALKTMRRREGEELSRDFAARIAVIEATLADISRLAQENLEQTRMRLAAKVESVAGRDIAYSRERLEMELVLAADKLDITEELTRFACHNKFFLEELHNHESGTGRKLNFLLQEQLREANTIASKSQNADISQLIVHIKEELEKIREQLQNIE
ncbi:MAG: YicC family protein [Chlorobi bacterium]|nr:YicC family protein [Chlorobiota bacterium]